MSDPIFQRGLQDLIKGIRAHKRDVNVFISKALTEIKAELRSTDPYIKAEAVRKLTYLQMIGYNASWASFSIVEVMSQPRFGHKRVGYLAANQSFTESTDVILLTTNLFKKELVNNSNSDSQFDVGLAINCLANIATKDLSRDCLSDMVALMQHSRPYVRKKAVLAMYKMYVKFPQGLRLTFDKLKDALDDSDSSVVSCAVNAVCELANKNPRNYLAMAPKFFRLLTTSSNNWMLIKVVKLLSALVPEEPRLARKLLEPLVTIIQNTSAKSLQYECIHTVTEALPYSKREDGTDAKNAPAVIKLCSDYLRVFIEDVDQNLKYLGLVGLSKLMRSHPRSVVEHRDLVLLCLNDEDVTIRAKALELLAGIVSRKSLVNLVQHLLEHARVAEGRYRAELIRKILQMGRRDKYSMVSDFAWYTSVLLELAHMTGTAGSVAGAVEAGAAGAEGAGAHGKEVADQLIEVALRVEGVRAFAVDAMLSLLLDNQLVLTQARVTVCEVLKAAAWIVGEYCEVITSIARDNAADDEDDDDDDDDIDGEGAGTAFWIEAAAGDEIRSAWRGQQLHLKVVEALLHPRATNLPPAVQAVYVHAAVKLFVRACADCDTEELSSIVGVVRSRLPIFMQSQDLEVQERATSFRYLLAELDVLPLDWEEHIEEVRKPGTGPRKKGAEHGSKQHNIGRVVAASTITASGASGLDEKEQHVMDLLDLPVYTQSSVQAVDDQAAQALIRRRAVLQSLCAEPFYAVHSKAQRRVPLPEELIQLGGGGDSSGTGESCLEEAFDQGALDSLLAVDVPQNMSINLVSLLGGSGDSSSSGGGRSTTGSGRYSGFGSGSGAGSGDYQQRLSQSFSGGTRGGSGAGSGGGGVGGSSSSSGYDNSGMDRASSAWDQSTVTTGTTGATGSTGIATRNSTDDVFMLGGSSKQAVDLAPLAKVLGEFEEIPGGPDGSKRRSRKHKDGGKGRSSRGGAGNRSEKGGAEGVNFSDVVPAGAVVEDGSDISDGAVAASTRSGAGRRRGRTKGLARTSAGRGGKDDDSLEDLTNVDLSTPLRPDEVLVAPTHRVVPEYNPSATTAAAATDHSSNKPKKKDKKDKKDKKGKREKEHKPSKKSTSKGQDRAGDGVMGQQLLVDICDAESGSGAYVDLLGSDDVSAAPHSPAATQGLSTVDSNVQKQKQGHSSLSASFSSSSKLHWLPLHVGRQADVMYAASCASSNSLTIHWKVVHAGSRDAPAVAVTVNFQSVAFASNPYGPGGPPVCLASRLAPGESMKHSVDVPLAYPLEQQQHLSAVVVECRLCMSVESLLGAPADAVYMEHMSIPISAAFAPHKLTEAAFMAAVEKVSSSSRSAAASVMVPVTSCTPPVKAKTAFKSLASFLRAHVVETELSSKGSRSQAASMSAKTAAGGTVLALVKLLDGSSVIRVDVKCTAATKTALASQQLADAVVAALSQHLRI